jgi:hypothetical protein
MGKGEENDGVGCLPYSLNNSFYSTYSGEQTENFTLDYISLDLS